MRRGEYLGPVKFRGKLVKGNNINVDLKVYEGRRGFFHMDFVFYHDKKRVFISSLTNDCFVNVLEDEDKMINPLPEFFLSALKKKRDEN